MKFTTCFDQESQPSRLLERMLKHSEHRVIDGILTLHDPFFQRVMPGYTWLITRSLDYNSATFRVLTSMLWLDSFTPPDSSPLARRRERRDPDRPVVQCAKRRAREGTPPKALPTPAKEKGRFHYAPWFVETTTLAWALDSLVRVTRRVGRGSFKTPASRARVFGLNARTARRSRRGKVTGTEENGTKEKEAKE